MPHPFRKILNKEYERLKKAIQRIRSSKKQQQLPQLVLQPVRNNKYFEGY